MVVCLDAVFSTGLSVPVRCAAPVHPARRTVLIAPGFGVAAEAYDHLLRSLARAGWWAGVLDVAALGPDLGYERLAAQALPAALDLVHRTCPGAGMYLCGHGTGGHWMLRAAATHAAQEARPRIRGLVLVGVGCGTRRRPDGDWPDLGSSPRLVADWEEAAHGGGEHRGLAQPWVSSHTSRVPILAIDLPDDPFAPPSSMNALATRLAPSRVLRVSASGPGGYTRWLAEPDLIVDHVTRFAASATGVTAGAVPTPTRRGSLLRWWPMPTELPETLDIDRVSGRRPRTVPTTTPLERELRKPPAEAAATRIGQPNR